MITNDANSLRIAVVERGLSLRSAIMKKLRGTDIEFAGFVDMGSHMTRLLEYLQPTLIILELSADSEEPLNAIESIMANTPVPILAISCDQPTVTAIEAISRGALEVMALDDIDRQEQSDFERRLRLISAVKVIRHRSRSNTAETQAKQYQMVAIAASTGGPKAILQILNQLSNPYPIPIVVVQHIGTGFIKGMSDWLNDVTSFKVSVAEAGVQPQSGNIYLAPDHAHLELQEGKFSLRSFSHTDIYRPSCDFFLTSVAKSLGAETIGIVLTGMGDDGARGLTAVKAAGGLTIAQDEASSVVFGMPRRAIESNAARWILPLDEIAAKLLSLGSNG